MQATRFEAAGRSTSNPRNDGEAWTQRLTSMTFEKIATIPFGAGRDPGGGLLHHDVRVDPAARRLGGLRARRTRRGTSASRSRSRSRSPRSSTGPGRRGRASGPAPAGSMSGASVTAVSCQKLPPTRVSRSGRTTPIPTSPSCVSAPPTTTGVPAARPVSSAAARGQRPDDRARLEDLGDDRRVEPDELEQRRSTRFGPAGRTGPSSSPTSGRSRSGRSAGRGPSR